MLQAPRPPRAPSPSAQPFDFATIQKVGSKSPDRIGLHSVEGFGKTSFAAQAPSPLFLMARGETGLLTLIKNGQLPETPYVPEFQNWTTFLQALDALRTQEHPYKTLVIDAAGGFERLCHEHVCEVSFRGDWTESGFASYGKGADVSIPEWISMLSILDKIREEKRVGIILLAHTKVKTFKNPEGPDYDRYMVDMNEKTWGVTHKWLDLVLFGNFITEVVKEKGTNRAKGKGGSDRILYTTRSAAYDAKNRHGLPDEIECGNSAAEAWTNFVAAMKAGKEHKEAA